MAEESNSSSSSSDSSTDGALPSTSELSADKLNDIQIARNSQNRVKLYVLCDQRIWDDRGTGHVACVQYPEDPATWCIVVRLEANEKNVLESPVHRDTVYQRQQGTLIVWSESDSCDLALSFQEKQGCTQIWERICQIQGKDPDAVEQQEDENDDRQSESSDSNTSTCSSVQLPACTAANMPEFEQLLASNISTQSLRERMATSISNSNYVQKLCEVFKYVEETKEIPSMSIMYSIGKNLFLLNSNCVLNELLDDNNFQSVVGMLEYDPTSPEPKKHREFLFKKSKFREVLPIKSNDLKQKIQLTYQAQYVQDVCLPAPSLFEENLLTCLTSHLFFARAEIVSSLLNDKPLMSQLFDEIRDPATTQIRRRDLTKFLKEFCSFVHSLQASAGSGREQFFRTVLNPDFLTGLDLSISSPFSSTRTAAIDILSTIVEYNPIAMRDFLFKQAKSVPESRSQDVLLNKIVKLIMTDKDPELTTANNISILIKNLLDAETILTIAQVTRTSPRAFLDKQSVSKSDKTDFFHMFYLRVIDTLAQPLLDNVKDGKIVRDDYYRANQMALILELLSFCVENHITSMRAFIINKNLLTTIGAFLKSKHQFMGLCALRVIRKVVGQKDEVYSQYMCDKKVLDFVVEEFIANGDRYNLMNSAILELFDFIRIEGCMSLIKYTITNHYESTFKNVTYVRTFDHMQRRFYVHEIGKLGSDTTSSQSESSPLRKIMNQQWEKERDYDNDELFFSKEDEEEEEEDESVENFVDVKSKSPQRKSGMEPMYPSVKRKLNSEEDNVASIFGGSLSPSISSSQRKIMIKVSDRLETPSPPPKSDENGSVTITPIQFGSNSAPTSPLVSSSEPDRKRARLNSAPSTSTAGIKRQQFMNRTVSTTRSPNSSPRRSPTELEFDKPIIMKGCSSLVDYDESDDDEEEEEEKKKEEEKVKLDKEEAKEKDQPTSSTEFEKEKEKEPKQNGDLKKAINSPDSTTSDSIDIQSDHVSSPTSTIEIDQTGDTKNDLREKDKEKDNGDLANGEECQSTVDPSPSTPNSTNGPTPPTTTTQA